MERKIMDSLLKWKVDPMKKPLLLHGISGCGKTYTTLEFGKNEYKNVIYFDCDNNLELNYVFEKNNTIDKLIRSLSAVSLETIFKEESLIVFDNITDNVLNVIKKTFLESSYHVVMITSSQDFINKNKVAELNLRKMSLVSFDEYLKYIGKEQLIDFILDSFKNDKPMPFHSMAMELFNDFVLTGGYPSAIINFKENNDYNLLSSIHEKNIKIMKNSLLELDNLIDIKRSNEVLDSMAIQLLKQNKKFQYGLIKLGSRAKDYEAAISYLENNQIIIKSSRIYELTSPLSKAKEEDNFKLYFNDSGILYKKMKIGSNRLLTSEKLLEILYENNVVQALSQNGLNIYHYHSGGKAEIDLVIQTRTGKIIPIEMMKSDFSAKAKSLSLTLTKYNLNFAIRFTDDNFSTKKGIKYIPYYGAFCLTETF